MVLYRAEEHRILELLRNLALELIIPVAQRGSRRGLGRKFMRKLKESKKILKEAYDLGNNATRLDNAIKKAAPTAAMELGTYCGYSAIRIGRLLPPGGKLVSVEVDPLYAAIATKARTPPRLLGTHTDISPCSSRAHACPRPAGDRARGAGRQRQDRDRRPRREVRAHRDQVQLGPPAMWESAVLAVPQLSHIGAGAGSRGGWLRRPLSVRASELLRARRRAGCHCGREARPSSPIPRRSTPMTPA